MYMPMNSLISDLVSRTEWVCLDMRLGEKGEYSMRKRENRRAREEDRESRRADEK